MARKMKETAETFVQEQSDVPDSLVKAGEEQKSVKRDVAENIPKNAPDSLDNHSVTSGTTVTVVWAEEVFAPKQFHTWRVGPFTATVQVQSGETIVAAMQRTMRDLRTFAEAEREVKRANYLRMAGG